MGGAFRQRGNQTRAKYEGNRKRQNEINTKHGNVKTEQQKEERKRKETSQNEDKRKWGEEAKIGKKNE
jgi:hypothetical protein